MEKNYPNTVVRVRRGRKRSASRPRAGTFTTVYLWSQQRCLEGVMAGQRTTTYVRHAQVASPVGLCRASLAQPPKAAAGPEIAHAVVAWSPEEAQVVGLPAPGMVGSGARLLRGRW